MSLTCATIYRVDEQQIAFLEQGGSVESIIAASIPSTRFELGNAWLAYDAIAALESSSWLASQQTKLFNAADFDRMFEIFGRRLGAFATFCEFAKYPQISDRDYCAYWQQHHAQLAALIEKSFFFMQDYWKEPLGIAIVIR